MLDYEIWVPIERSIVFKDYEVSSHGRIRNKKKNKIKKLQISKNGYLRTSANTFTLSVHVIVCEAFHGKKPSPIHHAAHWDGNKQNNYFKNLRWATPKENVQDNVRLGKLPKRRKSTFDDAMGQ